MSETKAIIQEWLDYSEDDLNVAKTLIEQQIERFSSAICFHSHQSVEKILKAYLISQDISFPKIHDLVQLNALIKTLPAGWPLSIEELKELNTHAVESRYPGDMPDWNTAKEIFDIASRIRGELLSYFELDQY
jgi:HEPN domain-containing protein